MIERPRWQQVLIALGKTLCYLALFLGWQFFVSAIYTAVTAVELTINDPMGLLDEAAYYEAVMAKSMEISLVSGLLTLGSVWAVFRLRRRKLRGELWLHPVPGRVLFWAAALSICLYWLVSFALALLPESWMADYSEASAGLEDTGVLAIVATALIGPVTEEVIFRGLVYTRLQRALPGWLAVGLSAAIFGACHGELVWFTYAFLMGTVFAMVVRATGSILPTILMHVVFNSCNEVLMFLPDWEPGLPLMLVILLLAVAGTALCALRLKKAAAPSA